jgi:hypothetical protein
MQLYNSKVTELSPTPTFVANIFSENFNSLILMTHMYTFLFSGQPEHNLKTEVKIQEKSWRGFFSSLLAEWLKW